VRDGPTDARLLESFLTRHDEAAFEALLRRHGPMVLGVCRRLLRHDQDAEDAFQATFLVLVRRAGSLRSRELLGNWLYGVAYRTALKARAMGAKRQERERRAADRPHTEPADHVPSEELLAQLDAALARLPDKYRVPVVLCELEGRSRREVATELSIPEGTLSSRLAYAKKLLARRLAGYGAGALSAVLSRDAASACVPRPLLNATADAALRVVAGESLAAGAVPAQVLAITEGVLKAMLLTKIKGFVAVAFVLLVGLGAIGLTYRPAVAQPGGSPSARLVASDIEELRLEVAALRKGLESTRERVKALENEVQTLKARQAWSMGGGGAALGTGLGTLGGGGSMLGMSGNSMLGMSGMGMMGAPGSGMLGGSLAVPRTAETPSGKLAVPSDPLADAEAALKMLRQKPDDKRATEALERALRRLKERQRPMPPPSKKP
jgi:RNA polymerase sigma-70 factor (ECF subfamily)